jgi:hypothetical protein
LSCGFKQGLLTRTTYKKLPTSFYILVSFSLSREIELTFFFPIALSSLSSAFIPSSNNNSIACVYLLLCAPAAQPSWLDKQLNEMAKQKKYIWNCLLLLCSALVLFTHAIIAHQEEGKEIAATTTAEDRTEERAIFRHYSVG